VKPGAKYKGVDSRPRPESRTGLGGNDRRKGVCKRLEKWRGPLYPLHEEVSMFLHCIGVIMA